MNNLELALAGLKAWEESDLETPRRLMADDLVMMGPTPQPLGKDAYLMLQKVHNDAFPDWRFNISELKVDGDTVRVAYDISATHTGPYDVAKLGVPLAPIPATGKSRRWPPEAMTMTFKDGKITHLDVQIGPGGGVVGTLEWLGAPLPTMA